MPTRRRPSSITFALCASLILHGGTMSVVLWWYSATTPPPKLSALFRPDMGPPIIVKPETEKPPPPPPPPPPKPAEKPKEDFTKATKVPLRDDSGETDGHGTANRSTPGERPMEAAAGLEQANLARSPTEQDVKSKLDDAVQPAQAGDPLGADAVAQATPSFGVADPMENVAPVNRPPATPIVPVDPKSKDGAGAAASSNLLGSPTAPREAPPTPTVLPAAPPKKIEGHSSIASDTDSPPFAKANSAHFHNGRMDARQGRRVKTTRIDFGLAANSDFVALGGPSVVLGVTVDAAGYVQNVVVLQSSGSDNIDFPAQRAVYNWWFEPKKDKDGKGLADLWVVTID